VRQRACDSASASVSVDLPTCVCGAQALDGYNCTVFAYGQTGTGKTFTLTGDLPTGTASGAKLSELVRVCVRAR
jgi:hypothetical protein